MKRSSFLTIPLVVLLLLPGCAEQDPVSSQLAREQDPLSLARPDDVSGRGQLGVMTWNIYVGADVDAVLGAAPEDVPVKVAEAYQMLQMTNFPERAATIARNIKRERPALIGLQEVSLVQLFGPDGAFVEETDFLSILLEKIHALGLDYRLADSVQNIEILMPRFAGLDGQGNPILDAVRLVDADVILARGDVSTSATIKGHYIAALPVAELGLEVPRGYVSVAAQVGNRMCRFVTTHLEAFAEQVRLPQAQELAYILSGETLPTIVVGDFNTDQGNNSPYEDATYQFLTGAGGFTDTWVHNQRGDRGPGYTFGHDADLRNPLPHLTHRLDLILVQRPGRPAGRHMIGPVQAEVLGDELKDRTPSGLWPSDHAGVVAKLHMALPVPTPGATSAVGEVLEQ